MLLRTLLLTFLVILAFTPGASSNGGGPHTRQLDVFSPQPAVDPSLYYVPGTGAPAVSTSDYYHQNGLYWWRPYDLTGMGPEGRAVAAREGKRYVWLASPD